MDFSQGVITTVHDICMECKELKVRMDELSDKYPPGVIIPMLYDEIRGNALPQIIDGLNRCTYLRKVFIALSAKNSEEYENTVEFFQELEIPHEVLWCNSPEVAQLLLELKDRGLDITRLSGKGKDLWLSIGVASLEVYAFAVHDADILFYSDILPSKLLYPIIEPRLDSFFSKGYYARINLESRAMYGRVSRLFVAPLLDALQEKLNRTSEFLRYLRTFRYPLSGEIGITSNLALNIRIPCDWGLEMGVLSELFRNVAYKRICQVDLGFYDHKHKAVSDDTRGGLTKTTEDVLTTLLRSLTEIDGIEVSREFLLSTLVLYRRFAQDRIRQYHTDAMCNRFDYDRHLEESTVESFADVIMREANTYAYMGNPTATQLPDWVRARSAMHNLRERLRDATCLH